MNYSITYASRTGNTKQLAEAIKEYLPDSIYFGEHDIKALSADRIYVGFWTDKGTCDEKTIKFLGEIENKEIFLFGTAGFGKSQQYFDTIIERVKSLVSDSNKVIGGFMCQGRMPMTVRERYEKLIKTENPEKCRMLIENFDAALSHPDSDDKNNLINEIKKSKP